MTITLPEHLHAWAKRQAAETGFASADEYVADLVRRERDRLVFGQAQTMQQLEALLLAGLNSGPAIEVTPDFWDERRRVLEDRIAGGNAGRTGMMELPMTIP
jgi:Arc/MetJ-type ribon-helix-helix transcriptional regulator